jgi:hypothetical protein
VSPSFLAGRIIRDLNSRHRGYRASITATDDAVIAIIIATSNPTASTLAFVLLTSGQYSRRLMNIYAA